MKAILTIGTMCGVLALGGPAAASSLAELSATMGTENALSAGAANGASTAHAAMSTVLRNLPAPPTGLETLNAAPSKSGGGTGGWATPSSGSGSRGACSGWATPGSGTGRGWVTASTSTKGGSGGWSTASSARSGSGWLRKGDTGRTAAR